MFTLYVIIVLLLLPFGVIADPFKNAGISLGKLGPGFGRAIHGLDTHNKVYF